MYLRRPHTHAGARSPRGRRGQRPLRERYAGCRQHRDPERRRNGHLPRGAVRPDAGRTDLQATEGGDVAPPPVALARLLDEDVVAGAAVAEEPQPVSVRGQVDVLGGVGAVEQHRVRARLALDGVAAVARLKSAEPSSPTSTWTMSGWPGPPASIPTGVDPRRVTPGWARHACHRAIDDGRPGNSFRRIGSSRVMKALYAVLANSPCPRSGSLRVRGAAARSSFTQERRTFPESALRRAPRDTVRTCSELPFVLPCR
jgi:hypothetical protein